MNHAPAAAGAGAGAAQEPEATQLLQMIQALEKLSRDGDLANLTEDERIVCIRDNYDAVKKVLDENERKDQLRAAIANGTAPHEIVEGNEELPAVPTVVINYVVGPNSPHYKTVLELLRTYYKSGKFGGETPHGLPTVFGVRDPADSRIFFGLEQVARAKLWKKDNKDQTSPPIEWEGGANPGVYKICDAISVLQMWCFRTANNYFEGMDDFTMPYKIGDRQMVKLNPGMHYAMDISSGDLPQHVYLSPVTWIPDHLRLDLSVSQGKREIIQMGLTLFASVRPAQPTLDQVAAMAAELTTLALCGRSRPSMPGTWPSSRLCR